MDRSAFFAPKPIVASLYKFGADGCAMRQTSAHLGVAAISAHPATPVQAIFLKQRQYYL